MLSWAFRHELTKRRDDDRGPRLGFSPVSPMFRHADLGVRVENFSREPGMPAAMGEPHPDALIVEAAVLELARFAEHRFEGDLGLLTNLPPGQNEHAAIGRAMSQLAATVQIQARLSARPTFVNSPLPAAVVGKTGKPIICMLRTEMRADAAGILRPHLVEERCGAVGANRYPNGAYCCIDWDNPQTILLERATYAAWWAALDLLAHELKGKLETIAVLPPAAAQRPWAGNVDGSKPRRILERLASPPPVVHEGSAQRARRAPAKRGAPVSTRRSVPPPAVELETA
ncbi:hypothetical protein [Methylobacterium gnaphalii]|uniref:Uncharacterized protein n=1 Tax=Methylobacterium gnaphalii TaxID=1010610 RepID=A0A512JF63_9HYPH|nr:hypothetical protein [Methylobacterium gnaphalii]GEP08579.1 hypothetical protein MGN01_04240 [Methylobacterium gnaphalii]GLS50796.1 hypothetical protein GCM10007885_36500 [Methylobacterium gnaphalii]